jgi:phage FluMu gp28-like protein
MLTESWYRENMPKYKAAFEDRSILLPKDADIIEDHRAFKLIKGVARLPDTKTKSKDKKQRHGDSGIAGAMALYAASEMAGYTDVPDILTAGARNMTSELDGYHGSVRYGAY